MFTLAAGFCVADEMRQICAEILSPYKYVWDYWNAPVARLLFFNLLIFLLLFGTENLSNAG